MKIAVEIKIFCEEKHKNRLSKVKVKIKTLKRKIRCIY